MIYICERELANVRLTGVQVLKKQQHITRDSKCYRCIEMEGNRQIDPFTDMCETCQMTEC